MTHGLQKPAKEKEKGDNPPKLTDQLSPKKRKNSFRCLFHH